MCTMQNSVKKGLKDFNGSGGRLEQIVGGCALCEGIPGESCRSIVVSVFTIKVMMYIKKDYAVFSL